MKSNQLQKLTGILFITGAILINIPYTLLIMNFNYPDILREPTSSVLTQFQAGGNSLIYTWLAFAWVGVPILAAIILLPKAIEQPENPLLKVATTAGVIASLTQIIGLLRWVFVVPILAQTYTNPASSEATQEAVIISFQIIHQYGGVVLGEHLGQAFSIFWMLLVSLTMFKSDLFKPWLGWFGIVASVVYALAQTELFATVISDFPVVPEAGLYGSLLFLAWMIITGIFLLRAKTNS